MVTQAQRGMDLEERPVFLIAAVGRLDQHVTHLSSRSAGRNPHRPAVTVLAVHLYQLHTGRRHQSTHTTDLGPLPVLTIPFYLMTYPIITKMAKQYIYFPRFQVRTKSKSRVADRFFFPSRVLNQDVPTHTGKTPAARRGLLGAFTQAR